jgi:hypothetical protein
MRGGAARPSEPVGRLKADLDPENGPGAVIDQTLVQAFQRRLSETKQPLYAVLDGASIPNLLALLSEQGASNVCLLPGELDPELAQAAPYLVQCRPQAPLTERFITQGLGNHWGILAESDADLRTLRMHFRKLLSVWDPDGKPLFFRYYDPRVLRVFLPTCTVGELQTFFGPVTAYYGEADTADQLLRFTLGADGLGQQPLDLSRSGASA